MPAANGSSTSRTSVRARCRISVANRSSDVAHSASAESSSACRSRAITCVETGSGSRPSRSQAIRSTSGSIAAYVPTVPESWPTRHASSARSSRVRARSSSNAQPASFQPNVVGSAWMPCERPMQTVRAVLLGAAHDRGESRGRCPRRSSVARVADLQRERGVDDVGRGEPVVDPAALRPELLGDRVDEGGEVVVGRLLDLGHALGGRRPAPRADRGDVLRRDGSDLGPAVERRELHLEPARQLALLRPDPAHLRTGVAGDHSSQCRARLRRAADADREDPRCEHGRVLRVVDADGRDRHARRHLHDREQRVEAVEHRHRRAQRDADHRQLACGRRRRPGARRRARRRRSAP